MSPGYPDNYKANKKCQWDITVPEVRRTGFRLPKSVYQLLIDFMYSCINAS